ncbi:hypothetical protein BJ170DRAFT_620286, partial [Xylariales sp. AK1849]
MGMAMVLSSGPHPEEKSLKVRTETADMYGPYTNERLIGRWFKEPGRRDKIFLMTKFGLTMPGGILYGICSESTYVKGLYVRAISSRVGTGSEQWYIVAFS